MIIRNEIKFATDYSALGLSKGYVEDLGDVSSKGVTVAKKVLDAALFIDAAVSAYHLDILDRAYMLKFSRVMARELKLISKYKNSSIAEEKEVYEEYQPDLLVQYKELSELVNELKS